MIRLCFRKITGDGDEKGLGSKTDKRQGDQLVSRLLTV